MKVCPNCHTPARFEEQKFCAVCGHHFGENEAPAPSAPQSAPVTPAPAVSPLEQPVPAAPTEVPEVPEAPRPVERRRPAPAPASPADAPEAPEAPRPVERRRPAPAPEAPAETPPAPAPAEEVPLPPEEPAGIPAQPWPGTAGNGIPPQQPVPPMPAMPPQARGNNRTVPLVVLGVIVLLAVVCILIFAGKQLLQPSSEAPASSQDPAVSESLDAASGVPAESAPAASAVPSTAPAATAAPAPTPAPTAVTPAVASDTQVVLRNAAANGTITVDGVPVEFTYVGNDAVIPRSSLSDVCQVRIVAPAGDGTYQTAAVWYNKDYGNDLSFGADYGAYVPCDETGLAKPGDKVVDVLTWAFYRSFLNSINTMDINAMQYSTAANTSRCSQEISGYLDYTYDLNNFVAVSDPTSIQYNEADGTVLYNGHFVSYHSNRGTNADPESADVHRTLRLVWQDGMWKVDAFMRLDDDAFNAGQYAAMP